MTVNKFWKLAETRRQREQQDRHSVECRKEAFHKEICRPALVYQACSGHQALRLNGRRCNLQLLNKQPWPWFRRIAWKAAHLVCPRSCDHFPLDIYAREHRDTMHTRIPHTCAHCILFMSHGNPLFLSLFLPLSMQEFERILPESFGGLRMSHGEEDRRTMNVERWDDRSESRGSFEDGWAIRQVRWTFVLIFQVFFVFVPPLDGRFIPEFHGISVKGRVSTVCLWISLTETYSVLFYYPFSFFCGLEIRRIPAAISPVSLRCIFELEILIHRDEHRDLGHPPHAKIEEDAYASAEGKMGNTFPGRNIYGLCALDVLPFCMQTLR